MRRLGSKTQVFSLPINDHVRKRSDHSFEVSVIAKTIAQGTGYDPFLCEASALGHDIGHTPFGHLGEKVLSELTGQSFRHNVFSVIVAQEIERSGTGLDLTYETLEGMLYHSRGDGILESTGLRPESDIVMISDKLAYTFSDVNDALRYRLLSTPPEPALALGKTQRERVDRVVNAIIKETQSRGEFSYSDSEEFMLFDETRKFMYEHVYSQIDGSVSEAKLRRVFDCLSNTAELDGLSPAIAIALLTDREITFLESASSGKRYIPNDYLEETGLWEIIPHIKRKDIDFTGHGLDWKDNAKPGKLHPDDMFKYYDSCN